MVYNKNEGIDMMEVKAKLIKIFYIIVLLISLVLSRFLSINIIKNNIKIDLIGDKTVQATYQDKYKDRGFTIEYFGIKRNIKHSRYKVDTNIVTMITKDDMVELPLMSKVEVADKILDKIKEL